MSGEIKISSEHLKNTIDRLLNLDTGNDCRIPSTTRVIRMSRGSAADMLDDLFREAREIEVAFNLLVRQAISYLNQIGENFGNADAFSANHINQAIQNVLKSNNVQPSGFVPTPHVPGPDPEEVQISQFLPVKSISVPQANPDIAAIISQIQIHSAGWIFLNSSLAFALPIGNGRTSALYSITNPTTNPGIPIVPLPVKVPTYGFDPFLSNPVPFFNDWRTWIFLSAWLHFYNEDFQPGTYIFWRRNRRAEEMMFRLVGTTAAV